MEGVKFCVVVQGSTYDQPRMRDAWANIDVIYSTWKGEEKYYDTTDNVIFNDIPEDCGVKNINLQRKSSLSGILLAEELGYDFVLKWRSDYIPNDPIKVRDIFNSKCLNFIAWSTHNNGYFIDYWFGGPTKLMKDIWLNLGEGDFPERKITNSVQSIKAKYNLDRINFTLDSLSEDVYCTFIRPGSRFNSKCLFWKTDKHWENSYTENNIWPV